MSQFVFRIHVLTIAVAASYVTLGLADTAAAERWVILYGVATLVLAIVNVIMESRRG